MTLFQLSIILGLGITVAACQADSRQQILAMDSSQVAIRSIQTRAFDTTDKNLTVRNIIATMQDLGFVVDKVDEVLGTVSGTKLSGSATRMTVTARPRGQKQMAVRASAQQGLQAISNAEAYQQFFAALEKSMFLSANQID